MSITIGSLLLVLACSLAWGGFDLARKLLAGKIRPMPLAVLLTWAAVPLYAIWMLVEGVPTVQASYWMPALGSVVLNIGANLGFFAALRSSALSLTIPLLSLTPVFATLLAIPMLGQEPTWLQWGGILLVVAGVFVLNLTEGPLSSWRGGRSALLMVLVAFSWSMTVPLDKLAMERASGALHALVLNVGVGGAVALVLATQRRLGELADVRKAPLIFLCGLLVSAVALALQLVAIQTVWVSLVETLKRGIGNVMALVSGALVFQEPVTGRKLVAVGLMALGVGLILM